MAVIRWMPEKSCFCNRVGEVVTLEVEIIYPSDVMPDMLERVLAHRCSHASQCMLFQRPTCVWSGGLPEFDPFEEGQQKE